MHPIRPLTLLTLGILSTCAQAVLVLDSFSGSSIGNSSASGPTAGFFIPGSFADRETAFDFHTGSDAVWLNQLDIAVAVGNHTTAVEASITTGNSAPGSNPVSIGSFTPANPTPTIQTISFQPAANTVLLAPNTRYWVHLTVSSGAGLYTLTYSDTQNNAPGWLLDETWAYTPPGAIPPTGWNQDATSGVAKVRLDATQVPEPSAALIGSVGLFFLIRRRKP